MVDGFQRNNDTKNRKYHFIKYKKLAKDIYKNNSTFDTLLPACLYLRLAIEDIVNQEFLYYLDYTPVDAFKRWQPRHLLSFLSDSFDKANSEVNIELFARNEGEQSIPIDAKPLLSASHTPVEKKSINKIHQRLSSQLHAPNPLNESSLDNLKKIIESAFEYLEQFNEQIWIGSIGLDEEVYTLHCECGHTKTYSLKFIENNKGYKCEECGNLFYIDVDSLKENSGKAKYYPLSKPVKFSCSNSNCDNEIVYDLFRPALNHLVKCKKCDLQYDVEILGKFKPRGETND